MGFHVMESRKAAERWLADLRYDAAMNPPNGMVGGRYADSKRPEYRLVEVEWRHQLCRGHQPSLLPLRDREFMECGLWGGGSDCVVAREMRITRIIPAKETPAEDLTEAKAKREAELAQWRKEGMVPSGTW
jgi:hypothetical protein